MDMCSLLFLYLSVPVTCLVRVAVFTQECQPPRPAARRQEIRKAVTHLLTEWVPEDVFGGSVSRWCSGSLGVLCDWVLLKGGLFCFLAIFLHCFVCQPQVEITSNFFTEQRAPPPPPTPNFLPSCPTLPCYDKTKPHPLKTDLVPGHPSKLAERCYFQCGCEAAAHQGSRV